MKSVAESISYFLVVVALLGVGIARAGNAHWIYLAGDSEQEGFSYDSQSVVQIAPSVFRVWTKTVNPDSSETKTLWEVDCSNKIIRDVRITAERKDFVISSRRPGGDVREVVRGTPEGRLFTAVCRRPAPESFPDWHRQGR